jgi:hypothetical protein
MFSWSLVLSVYVTVSMAHMQAEAVTAIAGLQSMLENFCSKAQQAFLGTPLLELEMSSPLL